MSKAAATRARPLSPHLTVYRWPVTMTMSILHRITGGALYFGTLLLVSWLLAAAVSEEWFSIASQLVGSWIGQLVLFGYTWALMHHMLGGIRHFIWDTGAMLEKHTASKVAWATVFGSVLLTLLIWVGVYVSRGL